MKRSHRVFLEANGPGPWPCYSCDELVTNIFIHHLDEDHDNDVADNLVAMHTECHNRLHHSGKIVSEQTRQKIAETRRGIPRSAETRAKISAARRGTTASIEARRRMSESQRGRIVTEDHKRKISETKRGKPWSPARRAAQDHKEGVS